MIDFSKEQQFEIRKLNPNVDSKFKYNTNRWTKLNERYKVEIRDFENTDITRQNIIDCYQEYFSGKSECFIKPFLLTMVWGFADAGYGSHRTNNYLSNEMNIKLIEQSFEFIKNGDQQGIEKAFKLLQKIKGLGISYVTKVLYFATKAKGIVEYSLIFDIRVAASLIKLTAPEEIYGVVKIQPSSKFNDYKIFNDIMHAAANKYSVSADNLEMYLFNQEF
jgi:hypothetical protein